MSVVQIGKARRSEAVRVLKLVDLQLKLRGCVQMTKLEMVPLTPFWSTDHAYT